MATLLDQLPSAPTARQSQNVLEGVLTERRGERWALVDASQQLLGPLVGAAGVSVGGRVCVAVSQDGTPFVVYPGGGDGAQCCVNIDGGHPGSEFGAVCHVDGNHIVRPFDPLPPAPTPPRA